MIRKKVELWKLTFWLYLYLSSYADLSTVPNSFFPSFFFSFSLSPSFTCFIYFYLSLIPSFPILSLWKNYSMCFNKGICIWPIFILPPLMFSFLWSISVLKTCNKAVTPGGICGILSYRSMVCLLLNNVKVLLYHMIILWNCYQNSWTSIFCKWICEHIKYSFRDFALCYTFLSVFKQHLC